MIATESQVTAGRVVSLHLHPAQAGEPLQEVSSVEVVVKRGIKDDTRYFGRISRQTGQQSRRQVSLIEREQIADHSAALGLSIRPGAVRANIETEGIKLVSLVGRDIQVGDAVLHIYEPRDPCAKMDAICQGLRQRMSSGHQGVMAEVVRSGIIRVGDPVRVL